MLPKQRTVSWIMLLLFTLVLPGCSRTSDKPAEPRDEPAAEHHAEGAAEPVRVSEAQRAALGIEVAAAGPGRIDAPV